MPTDFTRRQGQHPEQGETAKMKADFLESFRQHAIVSHAAAEVGINRRTVYDWKARDPEFADALEEAYQEANDIIRLEIFRRGVEGYDKQHMVGGKVYTVRKRSDNMLKFLAQSRMSEFRDKLDVTTAGEGFNTTEAVRRAAADPAALALSDQLLAHVAGYSDSAGPNADSESLGEANPAD